MEDSRRGFLTKCLGGLAVSLAPVAAVAAAKAEEKSESSLPEKAVTPGSRLSVETNYTPGGTSLLIDGRKIALVDELLIYRPTRSKHPWVGAQFIIPNDPTEIEKVLVAGFIPEIRYEPNRNDDCFPSLYDDKGRRFPMMLLSCNRDPNTGFIRVFMGGTLPVKLTASLADLDLSFMGCAHCGFFHRCLTFKQGASTGFEHWVTHCDIDTSKQPCPKCRSTNRQRIEFKDDLDVVKIFMTPSTSHLVLPGIADQFQSLRPGGEDVRTVALGPPDLDISNRSQWLAKELGKSPIAQISPHPTPFTESFSLSYAAMFGGLLS